MANSPDTGQPAGSVPAGPTMAVNHFALVVTASEILMPVGQSRVVMSIQGDQPVPQQVTEWIATIALSSTSAKQLHAALGEALKHYESSFGSIPQDPAHQLNVAQNNP